jgi:hypothetical protein
MRSKLPGGCSRWAISPTIALTRCESPRSATAARSRSMLGAWLSIARMLPGVISANWRVCPPTPHPRSSIVGHLRQLVAKAERSGGARTVAGALTGQALVDLEEDLPETAGGLLHWFRALRAVTHPEHTARSGRRRTPGQYESRLGEGPPRSALARGLGVDAAPDAIDAGAAAARAGRPAGSVRHRAHDLEGLLALAADELIDGHRTPPMRRSYRRRAGNDPGIEAQLCRPRPRLRSGEGLAGDQQVRRRGPTGEQEMFLAASIACRGTVSGSDVP